MVAARAGRHPNFLQRFLQVDDDLAAVGKGQGNHAACALVVDVGVARVIDAVAGQFNGSKRLLGVVQIIKVGHYNLMMFFLHRIIAVTLLLALALGTLPACGQKGPLFLDPQSVPYSLFPSRAAASAPAAATPAATPRTP